MTVPTPIRPGQPEARNEATWPAKRTCAAPGFICAAAGRPRLRGAATGVSLIPGYLVHAEFHLSGGQGVNAGVLTSGVYEAKSGRVASEAQVVDSDDFRVLHVSFGGDPDKP
jgi:hypothetical protein